MIVTVSNTAGIKQYNIPDGIKKIVFSFLIIIIFVIGGLSFYVKTLYDKVSILENNIQLAKVAEEKKVIKILQNKDLLQKKLEKEKLEQIKKEKSLKKEAEEKAEKVKKEMIEKSKQEKLAQVAKEKKAKAKRENIAKEKKSKKANTEKLKKEKQIKIAKEKKLKKAKAKKEAVAKEKKANKAKIVKEKKLKKAQSKKEAKAKKIALMKKKISKKEKRLPKIAKSKLGKRYVWGAIGPSYFDCSGFTSYVYKKTGINIPRTSRQQSRYGKLVDRKHLKPGDLIFFDTSRAAKGIINHVGMYIGNNEFIHASSAKKRVVITSLSAKFYSNRFKWARRVVN